MMLGRLAAALLAGQPERGAILSVPAGAADAAILARAIGADLVFAHPIWPQGAQPVDGIAVELAETDGDACARAQTLWPGSGPMQTRRYRRVDTLYGGLRDCGLLVLGEPAQARGVLLGAAGLCALHRPAVMLDVRGASEAGSLRMAVAALLPGYMWAEPAKDILCATPPGMDRPYRLVAEPPSTLRVPFDDLLVCRGLHPTEPGAPEGGRWTAGAATPWFILPRPAPGPWKLRLEIADWGNAEQGFAIGIEGATPLPPRLVPDWAEYGPFVVAPGRAVLRVTMFPPRAIADQIRWPRRIGLRIARATLVPA